MVSLASGSVKNTKDELEKVLREISALEIIRKKLQKQLQNEETKNKQSGTKVLTLTFRSDSAFKDQLSKNENGTIKLSWKGQMISPSYDKDMLNNSMEKHIFVKKGSKKRWNTEILGPWDKTQDYLYIGKAILIEEIAKRDGRYVYPVYNIIIENNTNANTTKKIPRKLTAAETVLAKANKASVKMEKLMEFNFMPLSNNVGTGPVYCNMIN